MSKLNLAQTFQNELLYIAKFCITQETCEGVMQKAFEALDLNT